jgi:hypothetical protein
LPPVDVRGTGARDIRATPTTCPDTGALAKDTVQPARYAEVSVMEGKIEYANQVSVVTCVFAGSSERAVIEHSSSIPAMEIEAGIS